MHGHVHVLCVFWLSARAVVFFYPCLLFLGGSHKKQLCFTILPRSKTCSNSYINCCFNQHLYRMYVHTCTMYMYIVMACIMVRTRIERRNYSKIAKGRYVHYVFMAFIVAKICIETERVNDNSAYLLGRKAYLHAKLYVHCCYDF